MQFSPRPGDTVTARGARWLVVDVRAYDRCRVVTLAGVGSPTGEIRRLLHPFDTIAAIDRPALPHIVSGARWRAACRAAIAGDTPPGSLREAREAHIDLMAHQLEPALAVLAGRGTRVLLADEVGLGKTIQAGLILRELIGRAWIERVLVLTPAGLRDQWMHELSMRFGIAAADGDAASLRRLAATLPLGMNPWSTLPLVVASTDYVKRAEVLPAVAACRWDALVVDEAHGAAGDSDRRAAVQLLASRAAYVVLLTATPHSGDRTAFASLCALGSAGDDALLVFRRRRADVRGGHARRIRTLHVRPSAAERAMHSALVRYSDAVRAERGSHTCLALSVLHKRAFSSPWSLAQSVARRLAVLERDEVKADVEQLALPLGDPDGEQTPDDLPPDWPRDLGLSDSTRDRRLLTALLEASRAAAGDERKLSALRRLLRRVRENAIVFTEYRDTLNHAQQMLEGVSSTVTVHGGMTRDERTAALAAFERSGRGVLLATDAAGEGLNLQRGCRLVVNLELPWNPMRLEQRIGRVDRIGQTRTVHAVHLVAASTGEMRVLDRLHARVARAQADIGAADPIGASDESRIARFVVAGECGDDEAVQPIASVNATMPDFGEAGAAEVVRLEMARALTGGSAARLGRGGVVDAGLKPVLSELTLRQAQGERVEGPCATSGYGPLVVRSSRAKLRAALGTKALLVWRLSHEDGAGRAIESHLAVVTLDGVQPQTTRAAMRRMVCELAQRLAPAIESLHAEWRGASAAAIRALADARLTRERAILARLGDTPHEQFQPGLFDRRAERLQHLARQHAGGLRQQLSDRIAAVERIAAVVDAGPVLVLAVLP